MAGVFTEKMLWLLENMLGKPEYGLYHITHKGQGIKHLSQGKNISSFIDGLCWLLEWQNWMNTYLTKSKNYPNIFFLSKVYCVEKS